MPIDLTQFHDGFFDEAEEHLARMEALLLDLDVENPDSEMLNAIFRAAHSIKGGSGTFGLTAMKDFTHVLESLLGRVRDGRLQPTRALVDVCLAAADVLREQVRRYRAKEQDDTEAAAAVVARIEAFADTPGAVAFAPGPARPALTFRILFTSALEGDQRVEAYAGVSSALNAIGSLEIDAPADPGAPTWGYTLVTSSTLNDVRDLFEFISTPNDILEIDAKAEIPDEGFGFFLDAPGTPAATDDPGFGFFQDAPGVPEHAAQPVEAERRRSERRGNDDAASSTIRVSLKKVDQMINLVGEMVIAQSKVASLVEELDGAAFQALREATELMQRNSRDLQDSIMSTRMLPIKTVFGRFPRMVRELTAALGKDAVLVTSGDETELDKGLVEQIADPLTHLVRNSLDHGIESPEARVASGKAAQGMITLRASHKGGNVVIEVIDDGGGLDRERILAKARERQLDVREPMSDREVWQLIFAPGFSTSETVTDISGRGVGMDVVKRNIDALGGRIDIESAPGLGTHTTIHVPLTLAILDGLSLRVGEELYILPLPYIIESIQADPSQVKTIANGTEVIFFRGEYVPLLWLSDVFDVGGPRRMDGIFVIIESSGRKAALVVDSLESQHQVVVKSLAANFRRMPGISGATILGTGRVTLILDVSGLLDMSRAQVAV